MAPTELVLMKVSVANQLSQLQLYDLPLNYYKFHFETDDSTENIIGYITFSSTLENTSDYMSGGTVNLSKQIGKFDVIKSFLK